MNTQIKNTLLELGISLKKYEGMSLQVKTPIDGSQIASLKTDNKNSIDEKIIMADTAFKEWRDVPAPKRGELIRLFGEELRKSKEALAALITLECGKIIEEGRGEVQEMIDICDFAVGLSRTVGGLTLPSERPLHSMSEYWRPLGVVGVISAFNFPAAVWAWNFALAIICGDSVVWKPSEKTPITAIACKAIFEQAAKEFGGVPDGLMDIIIGGIKAGEQMVNHPMVRLVSATGSCRMGAIVAPKVAGRFGKALLELGGNNAVIVTESADMDIAIASILFGATGTAGQRCTTTRRVFVHKSIYADFLKRLKKAYTALTGKIGDPLSGKALIGPLIDENSFNNMQNSLSSAKAEGGKILIGGERVLQRQYPNAYYVQPALVKIEKQTDIVKQETFAPILYVMPYKNLQDAIDMQNDVAQGLSSAIFTNDLKEAEIFKLYSDCGIANVNIGTSGAEIGGAFGGEKETGGGRESGSDSWKSYMRRQTSTTYYGNKPPALAQGIKYE